MQVWWADLAEAFETFRIELDRLHAARRRARLSENRVSGRFTAEGWLTRTTWAERIEAGRNGEEGLVAWNLNRCD
jgi:hypothetical protein